MQIDVEKLVLVSRCVKGGNQSGMEHLKVLNSMTSIKQSASLQWIIFAIAAFLIFVEYTFKNNSDYKLVGGQNRMMVLTYREIDSISMLGKNILK